MRFPCPSASLAGVIRAPRSRDVPQRDLGTEEEANAWGAFPLHAQAAGDGKRHLAQLMPADLEALAVQRRGIECADPGEPHLAPVRVSRELQIHSQESCV